MSQQKSTCKLGQGLCRLSEKHSTDRPRPYVTKRSWRWPKLPSLGGLCCKLKQHPLLYKHLHKLTCCLTHVKDTSCISHASSAVCRL